MMKMKNTNNTNNQIAFDYAIYMIVGSYFAKAKCNNPILEKRMRLHYCEQKLDNQYRMEESCIRYVEKILLKELPNQLWESEMQVSILSLPEGGSEIRFCNPNNILRMKGYYTGKNPQLSHELWIKKPTLM